MLHKFGITRHIHAISQNRQDIKRLQRDNYRYWLPIQSRWKDNDMYGHINNTE